MRSTVGIVGQTAFGLLFGALVGVFLGVISFGVNETGFRVFVAAGTAAGAAIGLAASLRRRAE